KLLHKNIDILLYGSLSELMKLYKDNRVLFDKERGVLSTFFNESAYKNYFQKEHGLNFLNKLNIGTCIYCNRNYTLQITSTHSRAQIDHWLPKTYFPFAALNFFNLIPSCQSCNHIKGSGPDGQWWINNWEHLIHPYSKEAMFKFNYSFNESMNKLSVELDGLDNDRIKTLASFNKIKEIYNAHSEFELRDLYDLRLKYSKNYLNHLLEKTFETNVSMEEKYRLLFGMEKKEDNYHLRPFSKFKNEIIEELV
ncbi:hypothetical protein HX079_18240, partial [Myroides odoratimimus]|uniref:HNH endonuclease domain-containing protein n=1 Tax=Myroides odoratimimus TaxID=76832 RepID=UPI0025764314